MKSLRVSGALIVVVVAATSALVAACGSASSTSSPTTGGSGSLVVAAFNPFSGPDASFGPEMVVAMRAAANLINANGGVLGHRVSVTGVDTRGDPADAVPAADKMLATTSRLVGILGPSSDEALATVPIINNAKIPMMADTGLAAFDKSPYPYFWRISPADDVKGYAMAIWAKHLGYTRAALVFGNDVGSQSDVPTLRKAFTKLGGTFVINLSLALDQSSYRTEITRLLAAKPQVIFSEIDPQTAATFLSELVQLNGKLMPLIGTETSLETPWQQAAYGAVGGTALKQFFLGVQPYAPTTGTAYDTFAAAIKKVGGISASMVTLDSTDPYAMGYYDSVNIYALAILASHSTSPAVFDNSIMAVTEPGPGKTVVSTFAQGKQALAAGKQIEYIGASGLVAFNRFHNSTGDFEIASFGGPGKVNLVGQVSAAQIAALSL
jgi:branched-chain amino acid transport system substrate-binding protein